MVQNFNAKLIKISEFSYKKYLNFQPPGQLRVRQIVDEWEISYSEYLVVFLLIVPEDLKHVCL